MKEKYVVNGTNRGFKG